VPQLRRVQVLARPPFGPLVDWLALALLLRAVLAQEHPQRLPSFVHLQAAGAKVGQIRVSIGDIFDTTDPGEDKWLFRWANALHIRTRSGFIGRALLFKTDEPLSVVLIKETKRLLRSARYL